MMKATVFHSLEPDGKGDMEHANEPRKDRNNDSFVCWIPRGGWRYEGYGPQGLQGLGFRG